MRDARDARGQRSDALPFATVCVVTYNGERWLADCLRSVLWQALPHVQIIVVDNASRDATADIAEDVLAGHDWAEVIRLPRNTGYAAGHNLAIGRARGDVVCLLNQDVVLDRQFLSAAVDALSARPGIGAVQGRILRLATSTGAAEVVDTTGLVMHRDRRIVSRDQGLPGDAVRRAGGLVFGPDGPAPVYRAGALRSAEVPGAGGGQEILDESFFLYHEDTDLAWRLALLGWHTWYEPSAVAHHARGSAGPASTRPRDLLRHSRTVRESARILSWRNQRLSLLKNDRAEAFLQDLPAIAVRELGAATLLFATNPLRFRAFLSLCRLIPAALRKRASIMRAHGDSLAVRPCDQLDCPVHQTMAS